MAASTALGRGLARESGAELGTVAWLVDSESGPDLVQLTVGTLFGEATIEIDPMNREWTFQLCRRGLSIEISSTSGYSIAVSGYAGITDLTLTGFAPSSDGIAPRIGRVGRMAQRVEVVEYWLDAPGSAVDPARQSEQRGVMHYRWDRPAVLPTSLDRALRDLIDGRPHEIISLMYLLTRDSVELARDADA